MSISSNSNVVVFFIFKNPFIYENIVEWAKALVSLLLLILQIIISGDGPNIYTIEDKKGKSGRTIDWICPAPIDTETAKKAQDISIGAFNALGCYDCARIDMRLDADGNLYILEINSLPSLGEHGSYTIAAKDIGLDFPALINRLVEVASARYFGTPTPPK